MKPNSIGNDTGVLDVTKNIKLQPLSLDGRLRREDVVMFEVLFESLLDVYFYAKDCDGHWISCNTASLSLLNLANVNDAIGIKEKDFFPKKIAEAIWKDDQKILNHGESVLKRIELITNAHGELIWVATNKLPIFGMNDEVLGIIGITRPILEKGNLPKKYEFFSGVIDFIHQNLTVQIKVQDLADAVKLSESQFRRKFKQDFGVSPQEFIQRARLQAAAHLLRTDDSNTICDVALKSGFSDQSYFTRQFKKFFGQTPKLYSQYWEQRPNTVNLQLKE